MKYNKKLVKLSTSKITDLLISLDNGVMDSEIDENPEFYDAFDRVRYQMIDILIRRYADAVELNREITYDLRHAYDTYVRHYLKC